MKKNHAKIINLLYRNERLTATEIGKRLDIEKGSLTTLIDQLEERGFVVRESDPADRRRFLIALSDAGREEMNRAMDFYAGKLNDFFQGIDPQELEQFMQSLRYAVTFLNKM
ncbi:MAG: MarR family transcriptional regulator [Peptococcaceae bacterium]|nr:MarR family transcriptional regulator [Peptococcaceae bacterium]